MDHEPEDDASLPDAPEDPPEVEFAGTRTPAKTYREYYENTDWQASGYHERLALEFFARRGDVN
jgi:hypothetical protein